MYYYILDQGTLPMYKFEKLQTQLHESFLAGILGMEDLFTAVKTIAGRRIERMDLARIAGNYFISYLEFGIMSYDLKSTGWWSGVKMLSQAPQKFEIRIDDSYNLS